ERDPRRDRPPRLPGSGCAGAARDDAVRRGRLADRPAADRESTNDRSGVCKGARVTRIGINGFGRIGRQTLKAILERHPESLEVVAVNDLAPTATNAHLFKYDSTYGRFAGEVTHTDTDIVIDGYP